MPLIIAAGLALTLYVGYLTVEEVRYRFHVWRNERLDRWQRRALLDRDPRQGFGVVMRGQ